MNFTVLQSLETELIGIKEIPVLGEFNLLDKLYLVYIGVTLRCFWGSVVTRIQLDRVEALAASLTTILVLKDKRLYP